MKQCVYYKGEELSDNYFNINISHIISLLKEKKIRYKDIIICKSDTQLGTYIQWKVCMELGLIPIFAFYEFSKESINNLNDCIGFKAILEIKCEKWYVYATGIEQSVPSLLSNIEDNSVIHMTSASTGVPKLVLRTKTQLDAELSRYSKYLKIYENDVVLPIVPISHSFGFISGMLLSMKVQAKLVLPDVLLPRRIIQLSNMSKATMMLGVPYFYRKMLSVSDKYNLNEELRLIIASGGPMEAGLQNEFQERFGKKLLQQYGSSETGSLCIGFSKEEHRCVGKPIPGVGATIINDEWDKPCLYVSSPETIGCYVFNDKIEKLSKKWYKTGDLGEIDRNGEIKLLGRCDDILIVDGKKVNKNYVSLIITQINGISAAKVYLAKNNDVTELTCEYSGEISMSKGEFVNYCRNVLAEYQIPKRYIRVENIQEKESWKTER